MKFHLWAQLIPMVLKLDYMAKYLTLVTQKEYLQIHSLSRISTCSVKTNVAVLGLSCFPLGLMTTTGRYLQDALALREMQRFSAYFFPFIYCSSGGECLGHQFLGRALKKKKHQSDFMRSPIKVCPPQLSIFLLVEACLQSTSPHKHLLQTTMCIYTKGWSSPSSSSFPDPTGLIAFVPLCSQVKQPGTCSVNIWDEPKGKFGQISLTWGDQKHKSKETIVLEAPK